uniref:Uncharacterized protein n=1 Tax=Palpitomonas bilix TaxID=652834 RepID=A0A7S3DF08_9EUKA|mmetsp:Transcript_34148/g.88152  ORF Transcript_34148/g.88152 Transcript_34148/m.88152 type:complete len:142 (+) Transcript_34148:87-512(+)
MENEAPSTRKQLITSNTFFHAMRCNTLYRIKKRKRMEADNAQLIAAAAAKKREKEKEKEKEREREREHLRERGVERLERGREKVREVDRKREQMYGYGAPPPRERPSTAEVQAANRGGLPDVAMAVRPQTSSGSRGWEVSE